MSINFSTVEEIQELLAKSLHENFRAACKAMNVPPGPYAHDHGYCDCGNKKKEYFRKRARLMLQRANNEGPTTLGQAEESFQARIFVARARVGFNG